MKLFLAGDVMTGRGIDQVLPHPVDPTLHESYVRDARRYVELAERVSGPIPAPVSPAYPWGDALDVLRRAAPDVRIVNLETAVTTSDAWWATKGIHYRMHPDHVSVLTAAGVDVAVLANNHVMDWGRQGLAETVRVLNRAGVATVGAGSDDGAAAAPATRSTGAGRLHVFAWATTSAGVPGSWRAGPERAGVNLLRRLDGAAVERVVQAVDRRRSAGDRVVVSIHWGPNWGYHVPPEQRRFAHRLIDSGLVDVIFGHSSHHPKGIEVYRDRLILYGAGDLINDYEGIGGREEYRGELSLLYFAELAGDGALLRFRMAPMRIRRFRLERAAAPEVEWLAERLGRESRGVEVEARPRGWLELRW